MFHSEQKGMKMYALHYMMKEQREGHNPGALGLEGWKKPSKKTMLELYVAGKITISQVLESGAKPKTQDHHAAMENGKKVTMADLEAAGINLNRTGNKMKKDSVPTGTRPVAAKSGNTKAPAAKAPAPVVYRWSNESPEVAEALREHDLRMKIKEEREAKGKKGFTVELTEKEKAELIARHDKKVEIK